MKAGWEVKPLGDFSEIKYGYTAKAASEPVGPRFLRITDIQNGNVDWEKVPFCQVSEKDREKHKVRTGDIVFARTGATTGKSFLIKAAPDAVCASYLIKVRPDNGIVHPSFLNVFFQTSQYWEMVALGTEGAAQGGFNASKLAALPIPLPPLEEQKRIVAVLDAAFEGLTRARANAEANLQNARELFAALLLGFQSRGREQWLEKNLEQLVTDDCTLSYGIVQPGDDVPNGLPIVRPTDLGSREIRLDGLKTIAASKASGYARTVLQGGELLLCVRGTTGTVGIAAPELLGANVTRGIVPVRFDPAQLLQRFGYYAFVSSPVQKQVEEATYGAALQQINIRDVRKLRFSFPDLNTQQEILTALDQAFDQSETLQGNYRAKLQDLDDLRQSLLQKAFAGELT